MKRYVCIQVMIFKSTIFKCQKGLGNIPTKTTQTTMKLISKQARKAYVSGTLMEKKKKWSDFGKIFRWLLMSSTSVVSWFFTLQKYRAVCQEFTTFFNRKKEWKVSGQHDLFSIRGPELTFFQSCDEKWCCTESISLIFTRRRRRLIVLEKVAMKA